MPYIELADGIKVEVDDGGSGLAGGGQQVLDTSMDSIRPILVSVGSSVARAWAELGKHVVVEKTEIELGLSIKGQAGWVIAKAETSANLKIKVTLKRPDAPVLPSKPEDASEEEEPDNDKKAKPTEQ